MVDYDLGQQLIVQDLEGHLPPEVPHVVLGEGDGGAAGLELGIHADEDPAIVWPDLLGDFLPPDGGVLRGVRLPGVYYKPARC